MVARIQPNGRFVVTIFRDGEVLDARTAATGERALKMALLMLASLDDLQNGDRLTVLEG
jgi:hypothetical protein